ncbi:MAG: CocE/NonD family hydrolase [Candidatus Thermoplasmatota archaeon]
MKVSAGFLFLAFAVVALAGCAENSDEANGQNVASRPFDATTLSPAIHAMLPAEEVWVTASDGQRINNVVYRPDTEEEVPVFINFSPYWADSAMVEGDAFSTYMIQEYVPRGFAVVLSAIRGTGHSEGCFPIGGDRESLDLNEVVEFFSKESWSNGNIAAGGKSYDSTSQNGLIAKFPHPALKGLFHVSGITDLYRYTMHDGVPYGSGSRTLSFTPSYYALEGLNEYVDVTTGAGDTSNEDAESLARLIDDAACAEVPGHLANPAASAALGVKTAYWQERDYTAFLASSSWQGSIFFVHGLQDWNVQPDHIQPWLDIVQNKGGIEVVGWLHQWQQDGTGHVYPMRTDWNETMLRWMDGVLKGNDVAMASLNGYESMADDGLFRRSAAWPPASPTTLRLADAEVACNSTCSIQDVPLLEAGAQAVRLAGAPTIQLRVQAQVPDPTLTVVLFKENATGRSWVGEGAMRLLLRDSLATPNPVVVGERYTARITLYPLDAVLQPGERWVLSFGAAPTQGLASATQSLSAVPAYPGDVFYEPTTAIVTATLLDPAVGLLNPQPEPMKCFTC